MKKKGCFDLNDTSGENASAAPSRQSADKQIRPNGDTAPEHKPAENENIIRAIARGFDVLRAFRPSDNFLSHSQIVERTGLPGPTVTRILHTLQVLRYVSTHESAKLYRLHPHLLSLGYPVLARFNIRQIARPIMQELANYSRATVALGVRDGAEMIYVERARDKTVVTAHPLDIGSRMPVATSAQGRAWLAGQPSWTLVEILQDLQFIIHRDGSKSRQELSVRLNCIATMVTSHLSANGRQQQTLSAPQFF